MSTRSLGFLRSGHCGTGDCSCMGHKDSRSQGPCTEFRNVEDWEDTEVGLGRGRVGYTHQMRKMESSVMGKIIRHRREEVSTSRTTPSGWSSRQVSKDDSVDKNLKRNLPIVGSLACRPISPPNKERERPPAEKVVEADFSGEASQVPMYPLLQGQRN